MSNRRISSMHPTRRLKQSLSLTIVMLYCLASVATSCDGYYAPGFRSSAREVAALRTGDGPKRFEVRATSTAAVRGMMRNATLDISSSFDNSALPGCVQEFGEPETPTNEPTIVRVDSCEDFASTEAAQPTQLIVTQLGRDGYDDRTFELSGTQDWNGLSTILFGSCGDDDICEERIVVEVERAPNAAPEIGFQLVATLYVETHRRLYDEMLGGGVTLEVNTIE